MKKLTIFSILVVFLFIMWSNADISSKKSITKDNADEPIASTTRNKKEQEQSYENIDKQELQREAIVQGNAYKMFAVCDMMIKQDKQMRYLRGDKQLLSYVSCFMVHLERLEQTGNYTGNQLPITPNERKMILDTYGTPQRQTEAQAQKVIEVNKFFLMLYGNK